MTPEPDAVVSIPGRPVLHVAYSGRKVDHVTPMRVACQGKSYPDSALEVWDYRFRGMGGDRPVQLCLTKACQRGFRMLDSPSTPSTPYADDEWSLA